MQGSKQKASVAASAIAFNKFAEVDARLRDNPTNGKLHKEVMTCWKKASDNNASTKLSPEEYISLKASTIQSVLHRSNLTSLCAGWQESSALFTIAFSAYSYYRSLNSDFTEITKMWLETSSILASFYAGYQIVRLIKNWYDRSSFQGVVRVTTNDVIGSYADMGNHYITGRMLALHMHPNAVYVGESRPLSIKQAHDLHSRLSHKFVLLSKKISDPELPIIKRIQLQQLIADVKNGATKLELDQRVRDTFSQNQAALAKIEEFLKLGQSSGTKLSDLVKQTFTVANYPALIAADWSDLHHRYHIEALYKLCKTNLINPGLESYAVISQLHSALQKMDDAPLGTEPQTPQNPFVKKGAQQESLNLASSTPLQNFIKQIGDLAAFNSQARSYIKIAQAQIDKADAAQNAEINEANPLGLSNPLEENIINRNALFAQIIDKLFTFKERKSSSSTIQTALASIAVGALIIYANHKIPVVTTISICTLLQSSHELYEIAQCLPTLTLFGQSALKQFGEYSQSKLSTPVFKPYLNRLKTLTHNYSCNISVAP